jgi:hypothetical protein
MGPPGSVTVAVMALPWFSGLLAGRPHRVDAVLAAAFCAVSLLQVLLDPIGSLRASVIVAIGSTLPLAWRRRRPVAAALAGSAVWLIPTGRSSARSWPSWRQ